MPQEPQWKLVKFSGPQFIVDGQVDTNEEGTEHLSMPIGPFASAFEAETYMESLGPLWGVWEVMPLWHP